MLRYPAKLERDGEGYVVTFRDIPEAITAGATKEEAWVMAEDALLNAMVDQSVRPFELAKRMGIRPQEVQRIMDLSHVTKIDTLEAAFAALGKRLEITAAAF